MVGLRAMTSAPPGREMSSPWDGPLIDDACDPTRRAEATTTGPKADNGEGADRCVH